MYKEFSIVNIVTNLNNKTIRINTTFDIDPQSVNDNNIQVYKSESKDIIEYKAVVAGTYIELTLTEWPQPNVQYIVIVQNLKNILGEDLVEPLKTKVIFNSSIVNTFKLLTPINEEEVNAINLSWQEIKNGDSLINSCYIEISTEVAFHNIVKSLFVENNTSLTIADLNEGQYYVRGRIQSNTEFGSWSETTTFVFKNKIATPSDSEDVIYVQPIEIIGIPENGVTPSSFLIELDSKIDPDSINEIIVLRSKI